MAHTRRSNISDRFKRAALLVSAALLFSPLYSTANDCPLDQAQESVLVQRVIDGDTVKLSDGRKLRFTAINTPELAHHGRPAEPYGQQAKQALQQLLKTTEKLHLRYGPKRRDRYQRLLAHAFLDDGTNVQAWLIKQGLAIHILEPPNLWQHKCYAKLEVQTEKTGKGLWSDPRYQPQPADSLSTDMGGFYRVSGRVNKIWSNRRAVWLGLSDKLALRIDKRHLKYFKSLSPESLKTHRVIAKGWMYPYEDGLNIRIKHPDALRILD